MIRQYRQFTIIDLRENKLILLPAVKIARQGETIWECVRSVISADLIRRKHKIRTAGQTINNVRSNIKIITYCHKKHYYYWFIPLKKYQFVHPPQSHQAGCNFGYPYHISSCQKYHLS
jgi:hypothetical protein